jgi:hypothetical protein
MKQTLLLTLFLVLTACAANQPLPTAIAVSTTTPVQPTATFTVTPIVATATATETPKPTEVVVQFTCTIALTRAEATNCPLTWDDINSGRFVEFAKSVDTTTFPPDVRIERLSLMLVPPSFSMLFWKGNENGDNREITEWFELHPDKVANRIILFGSLDKGDYNVAVKIVKYLNPSGRLSYLTYMGAMNNSADKEVSTFPIFQAFIGDFTYSDPEIQPLLQEWIDTGEIPVKLESKWLWEYPGDNN